MKRSRANSNTSDSQEHLNGAKRPMTECRRIGVAMAEADANSRVHEGSGGPYVYGNLVDDRPRTFTYDPVSSSPIEQNFAGDPRLVPATSYEGGNLGGNPHMHYEGPSEQFYNNGARGALRGPVINQLPTESLADNRLSLHQSQHQVVDSGSAPSDLNIDLRLQAQTPGIRFHLPPQAHPSIHDLLPGQAPVATMWPSTLQDPPLMPLHQYAVEGAFVPEAPDGYIPHASAIAPSPSLNLTPATQPLMPSNLYPQPPSPASSPPTTSDQPTSRAGARDPNGYYLCTKGCSAGLQPFSAFARSSQPYGVMKGFSHCNECVRKYRKKNMDVSTFNALYRNPNPERHREWKRAEQRRKEEQKREKDEEETEDATRVDSSCT